MIILLNSTANEIVLNYTDNRTGQERRVHLAPEHVVSVDAKALPGISSPVIEILPAISS